MGWESMKSRKQCSAPRRSGELLGKCSRHAGARRAGNRAGGACVIWHGNYRDGRRVTHRRSIGETMGFTLSLAAFALVVLFMAPPALAQSRLVGSGIIDPQFLQSGTGAAARSFLDKARDEVSVKDFGAKGDGSTNDVAAIQAAETAVASAGAGIVHFPHATYKLNSALVVTRGVTLDLDGSTLDFSGMARGTAISVVAKSGTPPGPGFVAVIRDGWLKGHATLAQGAYTAGLNAVSTATSLITFENLTVTGFEKPNVFLSNSFDVHFMNYYPRYNKWGVWFDGKGLSNLGEGIRFFGGVIGNNDYGIYNRLGQLTFIGTSLDYNRYAQVQDNITDISGVASFSLQFIGCHHENADSYIGTAVRYKNSGRMVLNGGQLSDDNDSTLFLNNGQLFIGGGLLWRVGENRYAVKGTGEVVLGHVISINNDRNPRISANTSNVENNGFESGALGNWTATVGRNVAASNTTAHDGKWSLRMAPTGRNVGTTIVSPKTVIPPGYSKAVVTFWGKNDHAAQAVLVHAKTYNWDGAAIDDRIATVSPSTPSFSLKSITAIVPPNGGYVVIEATEAPGAATTSYAYLDEFVLRFF